MWGGEWTWRAGCSFFLFISPFPQLFLCEMFLPIRFPISASFTNWLPSGCFYCHDGWPGVRAMLDAYLVFRVLFSLRSIFSFTFLIFSVIFLTSSLRTLLPFPIWMTFYPVQDISEAGWKLGEWIQPFMLCWGHGVDLPPWPLNESLIALMWWFFSLIREQTPSNILNNQNIIYYWSIKCATSPLPLKL